MTTRCKRQRGALALGDSKTKDRWEKVSDDPEEYRCTNPAVTADIEDLDVSQERCAWHVYQWMFAYYREALREAVDHEVKAANRAAEVAGGLAVQSGVMTEMEAVEATGVWLERSGFELASADEEEGA